MITIELPAFALRAPFERDVTMPPQDTPTPMTPVLHATHGSRRRSRFSKAEEHLLVQLKE